MSATTSQSIPTSTSNKGPREWHSFESASSSTAHVDVSVSFISRKIAKNVEAFEIDIGHGMHARRSIDHGDYFDPFIMLDEFRSDPDGATGFGDHPHRGFETVSYLFPTSKGIFKHEDFTGRTGAIEPGDVEWMTAGRGVVHCEMPGSKKDVTHGLQLWLNLASKDKMVEPSYQELKAVHMPHISSGGVKAIILAGSALGTTSPIHTRTPTSYIHFFMEPNSILKQPIHPGWNAFLYFISGEAQVGEGKDSSVAYAHHTVKLKLDGDGIVVTTKDKPAEMVLLAGKSTEEPIAQRGPFVMNTGQELMQAIKDFQACRNGFERAKGWRSKISQEGVH